MFNRVDGRLIVNEGQSLLYWAEQTDFGHLQNHKRTWRDYKQEQDQALLTQIKSLSELECRKVIERSFFQFLASLLGFDILHFSVKQNLLEYGIDSLTGVACQYWFYRELAVRITVQQMLASKTINDLLTDVVLGLSTASLTRLPSSPTPA